MPKKSKKVKIIFGWTGRTKEDVQVLGDASGSYYKQNSASELYDNLKEIIYEHNEHIIKGSLYITFIYKVK